MPKKLEVADILVASAVITVEQKAKAVRLAATSKCSVSEAVVKLGFAKDEAIAGAISKQLGIPYASRENKILKVERGQNLEKVVSEAYAREHCVLPLFLDDNVLAVAMTSPEDMVLLDNLKLLTGGLEIQPFVATRAQILRVIDDFYQAGGGDIIE